MSRAVKRTRTVAAKTAAVNITIRPINREKAGVAWVTHLVQGWQENGKWQRKQFKERLEAERFAALKRVELENQGRVRRMLMSPLTERQHEEALHAFGKLGDTYSLAQAVDFFLKHHRPPDFEIRLADALALYLDDKERDGIRPRTLKAIRSVVGQFSAATDNPLVHEVTAPAVESFLRGLRAKDGGMKASLKTWNNYRNDLHAFFDWCAERDAGTNRPFLFENPVESVRKFSASQVREGQNARPETTSPKQVLRLFSVLLRWRGGIMLRYFAYLYFAGIRPGELEALSAREEELVNLKTRTITIPAKISKTKHERQVVITENLAAWLGVAPRPIVPQNFDRLVKRLRKRFGLTHDEARHSFISYHVALHRSIGDAALQAGNSESIVRRHYLNTHTQEEGRSFFGIVPDYERKKAVVHVGEVQPRANLKAV